MGAGDPSRDVGQRQAGLSRPHEEPIQMFVGLALCILLNIVLLLIGD
jgi:hypothetical protein